MEYRGEKLTEESGQTDCAVFIPPGMCQGIAATDTFVNECSSNLPSLHSPQTTVEAAVVYIPIPHFLGRTTSSRGMKITSVEVYYDLDVAGTASVKRSNPYTPKGATGTPARLLVEFLIGRTEEER